MHDPMCVAHEIKSPFVTKTTYGWKYRKTLITIWHVDPETDGTDDSCGWFIRERHVNWKILEDIKREFSFQWKNNYWWDANGFMKFSETATLLMMYRIAAYKHFNDWDKVKSFIRKHLYDIILFAENETDCIFTYRKIVKSESSAMDFAGIVYTDILRKIRPWYKHPRWHIRHWKIQIHWPAWFKRRQQQPLLNVDHNLRDTV